MNPPIDLNADLGEGFPWDRDLLARVTSASLSCGAHAGDEETIRATMRIAKQCGVAVGAHPGYADRANFGRVERPMSRREIADLVREQVATLMRIGREEGVVIRFLKPHGALYNQAQRDDRIAAGLVDGLARHGLPILGLPGGRVQVHAEHGGLRFVGEGFIDRRYDLDGRLVPRTAPDAILKDEAEIESQLLKLARSGRVGTLCLHGDNPDSLKLADLARAVLGRAGIPIRTFA